MRAPTASGEAVAASMEAGWASARAAVPLAQASRALVRAMPAFAQAAAAFPEGLVALVGAAVPPARAVTARGKAGLAFPGWKPRARPRQGQLSPAGAPSAVSAAGSAVAAFERGRERPRIGRTR